MNAPEWLQRLADKHGVKLTPETSPQEQPSETKLAEIRKDDLEAAEGRRKRWLEEFAARPLTFDRDMTGINPKFIAWFGAQPGNVRDDIREYWDSEAKTHPDISHAHERGQHGRMTMVIHYAAEKHGYPLGA